MSDPSPASLSADERDRFAAALQASSRRASSRLDLPFRQRIAPMYPGVKPSARMFFRVDCRDVSCGGVSFYLDDHPDFDELIVALGCPPDLCHVRACVVHVEPVCAQGRARFLVGCRFLERMSE